MKGSPGEVVVDNPEVQHAFRVIDPPSAPLAAVEQKVVIDNPLAKPPMRSVTFLPLISEAAASKQPARPAGDFAQTASAANELAVKGLRAICDALEPVADSCLRLREAIDVVKQQLSVVTIGVNGSQLLTLQAGSDARAAAAEACKVPAPTAAACVSVTSRKAAKRKGRRERAAAK